MIGKKLHLLLNELTVKHLKILLHQCSMSNDKRYTIFKSVLLIRNNSEIEINDHISKTVKTMWENCNEKEIQLKIRRLNHFFTTEIENCLIISYINENSDSKQLIVAKALSTSSNSQLPSIYFQNAYNHAIKNNNKLIELESLEGKLNTYLFANSDKDLEDKLNLNQLFTETLSKTNNEKSADYFQSITNVYIENTKIVKERKDELIYLIHQRIIAENDTANKISLLTSLAKLHYEEALFNEYFDQAKSLLKTLKTDTSRSIEVKQNLLFLEVRMLFFRGKSLPILKETIEEILELTAASSSMYKNILFYKLLISILSNEITKEELNQNEIYYRGNETIYIDFLRALEISMNQDFKKAIPLLNQLIYCNNYFFSIFSRLLLIRIQIKLGNTFLIRSYINSTQKYININNTNPLSKDADRYTLNFLKNGINHRKIKLEKTTLTVLHQYILD